MTKEQEDAIKFLELHTNFMGKLDKGRCIRIPEENFTKTKESIKTVLNMLKEKDAEIEKYKQLYNKALSDAVTTAHNNIKQKKIIDLMADCIRVRDIGEDFCEFNKDCTKCRNGTREIFCKDCIKQYFERKVEDEN